MSGEGYVVPEQAGLEAAQEALSRAAALQVGERLVIDASHVDSIAGATAIVFANIAQSLAAQDAPVKVISPSSAFVDAFADLGLFEDLMKMEFQS